VHRSHVVVRQRKVDIFRFILSLVFAFDESCAKTLIAEFRYSDRTDLDAVYPTTTVTSGETNRTGNQGPGAAAVARAFLPAPAGRVRMTGMPKPRLLERILPVSLTADRRVYDVAVVLAGLAVAVVVFAVLTGVVLLVTYVLAQNVGLGEAAMPVLLFGEVAAAAVALVAFVLVLVFNLR
jgi:hypothetical protein